MHCLFGRVVEVQHRNKCSVEKKAANLKRATNKPRHLLLSSGGDSTSHALNRTNSSFFSLRFSFFPSLCTSMHSTQLFHKLAG